MQMLKAQYVHSTLRICVHKPYLYEHLRRTEHLTVLEIPKVTVDPRGRREHRLLLNAQY
jgi:hypothetical protein